MQEGTLSAKVVRINRRAGRAVLDNGAELPIVEAICSRGQPTRDLTEARYGAAEVRPGVAFLVDFALFHPGPSAS